MHCVQKVSKEKKVIVKQFEIYKKEKNMRFQDHSDLVDILENTLEKRNISQLYTMI